MAKFVRNWIALVPSLEYLNSCCLKCAVSVSSDYQAMIEDSYWVPPTAFSSSITLFCIGKPLLCLARALTTAILLITRISSSVFFPVWALFHVQMDKSLRRAFDTYLSSILHFSLKFSRGIIISLFISWVGLGVCRVGISNASADIFLGASASFMWMWSLRL